MEKPLHRAGPGGRSGRRRERLCPGRPAGGAKAPRAALLASPYLLQPPKQRLHGDLLRLSPLGVAGRSQPGLRLYPTDHAPAFTPALAAADHDVVAVLDEAPVPA